MAVNPLPGQLLTVNEQFFDAVIRHQVGLMRLSGSIKKDVIALLDATEQDMADKIRSRLLNHKGLTTPGSIRRMQSLLKVLRSTRLETWKDINRIWVKEMRNLARAEVEFMDMAFKTSVPVVVETALPSVELLDSIVRSKPFQGKTMREWTRNISRADISRIESEIKTGMVQGESSATIARRVVGTRRFRGVDGAAEITRRQATAITRTAVNSIANFAKREYYIANKEHFTEEQYVATLDNRTTLICQSLDGQRFPVGQGPIPPVHIMCRSTRVGVIGKDVIGNRGFTFRSEKRLVREFTKQRGIKGVTNRKELPRGTKGQFDKFARKRARELTGTVPAKVTYQEWLGRQTVEFQNEVLGTTKARLFRRGKMPLTKFVNRAGDELTLSQLAQTDAKFFRAAGLDPGDFL